MNMDLHSRPTDLDLQLENKVNVKKYCLTSNGYCQLPLVTVNILSEYVFIKPYFNYMF